MLATDGAKGKLLDSTRVRRERDKGFEEVSKREREGEREREREETLGFLFSTQNQ